MAWLFDEVNDEVQITDHAALTLPDADWTIAGSIRWPDHAGAGYQWFLSWGGHSAAPSLNWYMFETTGAIYVLAEDADTDQINFNSGAVVPALDTNWHQFILQRSGTTVTQYIDGVAAGAETLAAFGAVNVAGNLFFGCLSNETGRFGGDMAEWAKWDRALTAGEIAAHAKGFSPACFAGRVWHLDMIRPYRELIVPLTVTNDGSVVAPHPPTIYPFGPALLGTVPDVAQRYSVDIEPRTRGGRGKLYLLTFRTDEQGKLEVAFDGRDEPLIGGVINRLETAPNLQNPPDANWDVTLEDEWGRDVLGGAGMNRSNSAAEPAFPYHALGTSGQAERMVGKPLWLRVANAGRGKAAQIGLFLVAPLAAR